MHVEPKIIHTNLTLCMDIQLNLDKISQIYQDRVGFLWLVGFFYHPSLKRDEDIPNS